MKDQLRFSAMQLAGGMSKQPAHLRLPGQLEDSQNIDHSVVDGLNKRSGTWLDRVITTLDNGGVYRLTMFNRDQNEDYAIISGRVSSSFAIKAYRLDGVASTVTISSDAQKYLNLNQATADQIRPRVIGDTIEWINTTVMVGTLPGITYSLTATWRDYEVMVSNTPTDATYHRATNDIGEHDAGFYKYDVGGRTFAVRIFATVSGSNLANARGLWDNTADQPFKLRIGFQRRSLAVTGAAWDGTNTITKTAAFTEVRTGEYVFLASGTGVAGTEITWYPVVSRTDNAIVIDPAKGINTTTGETDIVLSAGATADFALTGLGAYVEASFNALTLPDDMFEVAAAMQQALRNVGVEDALCSWIEEGFQLGHFTITSTYRGSGATFFGPYPASTGGTNLQAAGVPFNGSGGSTTTGTGTIDGSHPDNLDVADRWTQTVASGQADAQIDPATMPVVMKRTQLGTTSIFTVEEAVFDQRATGDADSNPSPSLWNKDGATQGAITAVSIASPGVVTSAAHGLSNGDTVHITDSNTTPTIDGVRTVANVTTDTYTVGVNTSGSGTSGTWRKGGNFLFDAAHKNGRKFYAGGEAVVLSQIKTRSNWYLVDADNIVDSDPIDVPIGSELVTNVDFLVPFRKTVVAFTMAGRQFELTTPEALTPSSAGWDDSTAHYTRSVRPKALGSRLYFVGVADNYSILFEYIYNDLTVSSTAFEVTTHVIDLLPTGIRSLEAHGNTGRVIVLPNDDGLTARMFAYKSFWDGDKKVQSAWSRWTFDGGYRICDIAVQQDRLWMLVESCGNFTSVAGSPNTTINAASHGFSNGNSVTIPSGAYPAALAGTWTVANKTDDTFTIAVATTEAGYGKWSLGQYTLERMTLSREGTETNWSYPVKLDRKIKLTGVEALGVTTWTLNAPNGGSLTAEGSTLNTIVLGPAFGASSGTELAITTYGATNTVSRSGDYDAGQAVLGRFFTCEAEVTRPFVRDQGGNVDLYGTVNTNELLVTHASSGGYSVVVDYIEGQADSTTSFSPLSTLSATKDSIFKAQAVGPVELFSATITSNSAKPFSIGAIQWVGDPADVGR